jgi:hypothetical protein
MEARVIHQYSVVMEADQCNYQYTEMPLQVKIEHILLIHETRVNLYTRIKS